MATATSHITLDMVIAELTDTLKHRKKGYRRLVKRNIMSHYTAEHKTAVIERLLEVAMKARTEKDSTVYQQFQQMNEKS